MNVKAFPQANRKTKEYPLASGESFLEGAAVVLDANEEVTECGVDPTAVLGFAAGPADGRIINSDLMTVNLAHPEGTFFMAGDAAPTEDNIGQDYGLVSDGDSVWIVDTSETTNVVVNVVAVDLERNLFEVVVLASDRQLYT